MGKFAAIDDEVILKANRVAMQSDPVYPLRERGKELAGSERHDQPEIFYPRPFQL